VPPAALSVVRYWDTAFQKKKTSDFTVGLKYGIARNGLSYILHVARAQATPHEVETFIANTAGQDGRAITVVLQQEPGSGSALWIDSMRRGILMLPCLRRSGKGHQVRALAAIPRCG
jgi:phage terminase large subunit-like protein